MFTVDWSDKARDGLAAGWIAANSAMRQELTAGVALLDKNLRANATRIGESRDDESLRIVSAGPLGVEFHVAEEDRLVTIVRAWVISHRQK